ncbi:MAG TPA: DUF1800 domain-containing protein [Pyrinomonadaceae bacterium]|nr:DUF1800 domain-containing protein [Pyrinomonadaceae bacterium]
MTEIIPCRFRASWPLRFALLCALLCAAGALHAASAAPVILTEATSTRAIAVDSLTKLRDPFPLTTPGFTAGADTRTRVTFFVLNLDLLAGEGANALTADAEDSAGRKYVLAVENVTAVPGFGAVQQVVVRLSDDLGDVGDLLVRINLHGVASNRARISVGHAGGSLPDDPGATPAPAPAAPPAPTPTPTPNQYGASASTTADTVRFLEQATWGPTSAEVARVRAAGLRAYLNEQFNAPVLGYPSMPLYPTDSALGCPSGATQANCLRDNYSMYPLQVKFFQNALAGGAQSDQLRQRVAFALHQVFVVSGRENPFPAWMAYYLQILDRNAFGNFRNLLHEITLNPAMGEYLNMRGNLRTNPNENYAREILQLFSIGTDELNLDGTPKLDVQGRRIPSYTQDTINNFARVFTGWNLAANKQTMINGVAVNVFNYQDPMISREQNHDTAAKQLLNGLNLPPGQTSAADLNAALDNIFNHPNVGPFIGRQLIQHLVTSNPSAAYVERVARVFNNDCDALYPDNCANARGELKAVVRAVLLDPEARGDVKTDPKYGKLREPVQLLTNLLRAFNATSDGVIASRSSGGDLPANLEQPLFLPATVFSYYTPTYEVPGTGLLGPAFEILSTSSALRRANTVNQLLYTGIAAGTNNPTGTQLNFASLEALAGNPAQLLDALDSLFMHNTLSAGARASITTAVESIPATDANYARKRVQAAAYLVATSHQYQVQR